MTAFGAMAAVDSHWFRERRLEFDGTALTAGLHGRRRLKSLAGVVFWNGQVSMRPKRRPLWLMGISDCLVKPTSIGLVEVSYLQSSRRAVCTPS